eukprot:3144992-Prymnesium_polylepis.2
MPEPMTTTTSLVPLRSATMRSGVTSRVRATPPTAGGRKLPERARMLATSIVELRCDSRLFQVRSRTQASGPQPQQPQFGASRSSSNWALNGAP